MDQICPYRFALSGLLKSPRAFAISTRGPRQFRNNYSQVQFLAFQPLSFPRFEPAVHPWLFHVLAPRSFQFLHLGPRFLQKTPRNSVFLSDRSLGLVLSVVFTFQLCFRCSLCPRDRCSAQNSSSLVLFAVFMYCCTVSQCLFLFACMCMCWTCFGVAIVSRR